MSLQKIKGPYVIILDGARLHYSMESACVVCACTVSHASCMLSTRVLASLYLGSRNSFESALVSRRSLAGDSRASVSV
jgi:hypothetical protein